jgi:hypothetical protein
VSAVVDASVSDTSGARGRCPGPEAKRSRWMYPPRGAGKRIGVSRGGGTASSASTTIGRSWTTRSEPAVLPPSSRTPCVKRRRTWTVPASRSTSERWRAIHSSGRSPAGQGRGTRSPFTGSQARRQPSHRLTRRPHNPMPIVSWVGRRSEGSQRMSFLSASGSDSGSQKVSLPDGIPAFLDCSPKLPGAGFHESKREILTVRNKRRGAPGIKPTL